MADDKGERLDADKLSRVFPITARLLFNGVRFRVQKYVLKRGWPTAVSLEITHDCIARCIMCNIWKIPRDVPNLPVKAWLRLLSSPLFTDLRELDITGGEPYLVADLPNLTRGIHNLHRENLARLQSVIITTNGILSRSVVETTAQMLRLLEDTGIELVVVCALDAVSKLHDKIRRVSGAWDKVQTTLHGLIQLRKQHENLVLGLKTTIVPANVGELKKIVSFADRNELFAIISPAIVTSGRYRNVEQADALHFSAEDIERILEFYRLAGTHWRYHSRQVVRLLRKGSLTRHCTCGFSYFFVRSNGDVYLCPLAGPSVGNISKAPIEQIWNSPRACQARRNIGKMDPCSRCTEPGLERYSLPYEGFALLKYIFEEGPSAFLDLYRHMGLQKHLDPLR